MSRITQALLTFGKAETSAAVASVVDFALTILLVKAVGIWYALASFSVHWQEGSSTVVSITGGYSINRSKESPLSL